MLDKCIAYRVFVASPEDCDGDSGAVYSAVLEWNATGTFDLRRVMIPKRWARQGIPMAGGDPQELINENLLSNCDLLIALFRNRLGGRGTEREIRYFMEKGKGRHVMLFVHHNDENREPELRSFLDEFKNIALFRPYFEGRDLADQVASALSYLSLIHI